MKTRSKYLLLSLGFAFLTFLSIQAQPPGAGRGKGQRGPDSCRIQLRVDDMRQALDLNEKQVKQIQEIHYAHFNNAAALRKEYQNDCVGEREARRQLRDNMDKEVKAVLTKEQLPKYDEFVKDFRGPHGHGRGNK